jgi:potassium-transporting ATPase KdpC subunit
MNSTTSGSAHDNTLRHLVTSVLFTLTSVVALGFAYPLVVYGLTAVLFHHQAGGSLVEIDGKVGGSELVGQAFAKAAYFHGRPSAAGKGYDPTQTGATNYGPTNKKLIASIRAAIAELRKENPDATDPIPIELVTSSASGIDPDISPEAAYYQAGRVARARGMTLTAMRDLIARHVTPRQLGFLGEPRVNVLNLNRALDAQGTVTK